MANNFTLYLLICWEVEEFSRNTQRSLADVRGNTCARGLSSHNAF